MTAPKHQSGHLNLVKRRGTLRLCVQGQPPLVLLANLWYRETWLDSKNADCAVKFESGYGHTYAIAGPEILEQGGGQ